MKRTNSAIAKAIAYGACAIILIYAVSYPVLRMTHILVLRKYSLYGFTQDSDILVTDCVDIGRGSAFEDGREKLSPKSCLAGLYRPLYRAELYVRGYSEHPISWVPDGPCNQ